MFLNLLKFSTSLIIQMDDSIFVLENGPWSGLISFHDKDCPVTIVFMEMLIDFFLIANRLRFNILYAKFLKYFFTIFYRSFIGHKSTTSFWNLIYLNLHHVGNWFIIRSLILVLLLNPFYLFLLYFNPFHFILQQHFSFSLLVHIVAFFPYYQSFAYDWFYSL